MVTPGSVVEGILSFNALISAGLMECIRSSLFYKAGEG